VISANTRTTNLEPEGGGGEGGGVGSFRLRKRLLDGVAKGG